MAGTGPASASVGLCGNMHTEARPGSGLLPLLLQQVQVLCSGFLTSSTDWHPRDPCLQPEHSNLRDPRANCLHFCGGGGAMAVPTTVYFVSANNQHHREHPKMDSSGKEILRGSSAGGSAPVPPISHCSLRNGSEWLLR